MLNYAVAVRPEPVEGDFVWLDKLTTNGENSIILEI
jgi:hypothetical protein